MVSKGELRQLGVSDAYIGRLGPGYEPGEGFYDDLGWRVINAAHQWVREQYAEDGNGKPGARAAIGTLMGLVEGAMPNGSEAQLLRDDRLAVLAHAAASLGLKLVPVESEPAQLSDDPVRDEVGGSE